MIWAQRSSLGSTDDLLSIERRRRDGTEISYIVLGDHFIDLFPSPGGGTIEVKETQTQIASALNVGLVTSLTTTQGDIKLTGKVQPSDVPVAYLANYNASLANNGVMALGMSGAGFALVWAGGSAAIYAINGTNHTTTEISDPSAVFTTVAGTASSINIFWNAANTRYELENKRGSAIAVRIWLMEA